jgi:hypothetical protein
MKIMPLAKAVSFHLLLCAAAALLIQCGEEKATGPQSCSDIGDDATRSAANPSEPAFKVIFPNGGETFTVGDSITVRVGSNAAGNSALVYLVVKTPALTKRLRMPGTPSGSSLNPRTTCEISFRIPASITETDGTAYSLVSDDVKVRIAAYNSESLFNDESDASFIIRP